MSSEVLYLTIERAFNDLLKLHEVPAELPEYIHENLRHEIRPYQGEALRHFIFTQRSGAADIAYNYLMFHMATGSGKTMVLAASILYLYKEHGYKNFLFFADSDAIVRKTTDNLTNSASPKYLYNPHGIVLEGEQIQIQSVDVFPRNPAPNTVYLKVTSIQKLHSDLTEPKENGLTYEYLEDMRVVMLADEAHHYLAETKRDKKKLSKKEAEVRSWERTIDRLLNLNRQNRLLGFSATFNLDNELLAEKLRDKIVYRYDLKRFMESGYSKNVVLLQTNEDDRQKMLHAILLSQYRKYIARDHEIELKPIILFKSNKIATSLEAHRDFRDLIDNLSVTQLRAVIDKGLGVYKATSSIWNQMYRYYNNQDLSKVIGDLQWEFTEENLMNANDAKFLSEDNTLRLNTLEEPDNPIRVIFAVAKLNEGWDVLNLYDIVRISEGASATKTTTDSEAQLIGRGARYYPFAYEGNQSYQRRFDMTDSELKVIETLHYHTINESAYIQNLNKSLDAADILVKEDEATRYEAKVKAKFKQTNLYRNGHVYINRVVPTKPEDYQSFKDYNISKIFEVEYEVSTEKRYGSDNAINTTQTHAIEIRPDRRLWQKAIQRNPFFRFSNLKRFMPSITSVDDLINRPEFLKNVRLTLLLPSGLDAEELSPSDKLYIAGKFLEYAANRIRLNYMKEKGTPVFYGVRFPELIQDYFVEVNHVKGRTFGEIVHSRSMRGQDWYIFDKAIVNGLERDLIDFIGNYMDQLEEEYKEAYLIRNERKVKIVEIDGTRGFMPDFLLYLKDEECTYQVFIEPKNDVLYEHDKWKEEFLLSLSCHSDIEVLAENADIRLLGLKFYMSQQDKQQEFREDFTAKLLDKSQ